LAEDSDYQNGLDAEAGQLSDKEGTHCATSGRKEEGYGHGGGVITMVMRSKAKVWIVQAGKMAREVETLPDEKDSKIRMFIVAYKIQEKK
jgi:hypothetical protein